MTDAPTPEQLENRRKWVALLRSDKYTQTTGTLAEARNINSRCCLGVACDKAILPDVKPVLYEGASSWDFYGGTGFLPEEAQEALGMSGDPLIPATDPVVAASDCHTYEAGAYDLTYLNDTAKLNFAQIADVIERNFVTPFDLNANITLGEN